MRDRGRKGAPCIRMDSLLQSPSPSPPLPSPFVSCELYHKIYIWLRCTEMGKLMIFSCYILCARMDVRWLWFRTEVCYLSLMPLLRQHTVPCCFIWHQFSVSADAHQCCWFCSLLSEHFTNFMPKIHGECNVHVNRRTPHQLDKCDCDTTLLLLILLWLTEWLNIVAHTTIHPFKSHTSHVHTVYVLRRKTKKETTTKGEQKERKKWKTENNKEN